MEKKINETGQTEYWLDCSEVDDDGYIWKKDITFRLADTTLEISVKDYTNEQPMVWVIDVSVPISDVLRILSNR